MGKPREGTHFWFSRHELLEINGITKTLEQWAQARGVTITTVRARYVAGKRGRDLLVSSIRDPLKPPNESKLKSQSKVSKFVMLDIDGVEMSLFDWASFYRVEYSVVKTRYARGKRGIDLFASVRAYA